MLKYLFVIVSFIAAFSPSARAQDDSDVPADAVERRVLAFVHYGNLSGVGIGLGYRPGNHLRVEGTLGAVSPIDIGLGPPFSSHFANVNAHVAANMGGFYLGLGGYAGLFKLRSMVVLVRPRAALGWDGYGHFGFEVGAVFAMPTEIKGCVTGEDFRSCSGETREAPGGSVFPFFTVRART